VGRIAAKKVENAGGKQRAFFDVGWLGLLWGGLYARHLSAGGWRA
jgi:hypothetical protein